MAEQDQQAQETFEITTTAQVERTYLVLAADEDQAHKRLRTFLADADMLRGGLVTEQKERQVDTTAQRTKAMKKVAKPRVVKDNAAASEAV